MCSHSHYGNHGLLALAAIIGLLLLGFNRRRGARFAVLITLAVLIVCGCSLNKFLLRQNINGGELTSSP